MEWLKALLEKAEIKDGKLDIEGLMKTVNAEAPKNIIPKAEFNSVNTQLKQANDTIKDLKKNNADNEALQTKIKEHEDTIKDLKATHAKELDGIKIDNAIKEALSKANCTHPELVSKALDREKIMLDKDGEVIGLDEQIKASQENYKDMFKTETTQTRTYETYNPQSGQQGKVDPVVAEIEAAILGQ